VIAQRQTAWLKVNVANMAVKPLVDGRLSTNTTANITGPPFVPKPTHSLL